MSGLLVRAQLALIAAGRVPPELTAVMAARAVPPVKKEAAPAKLTGEKDLIMLTAENNQLKDFHCQNKQCRAVLCQTDGLKIYAATPEKQSALLSHRKKRANLLYCPKCHRYSRWRRVGEGGKS